MGNFQRGNKSGFGGRSFGYDRNRDSGRPAPRAGFDRPQMFRATCANCGNECEVPFRPTGSKPIFCNNCFDRNAGQSSGRKSFSDRDARVRSSFADRPMYDAVCTNCGNACRIPFEPREGREILCSNCFEAKTGSAPRQSSRMSDTRRPDRSGSNNSNNAQIEMLNAKLDKIMAHLGITEVLPVVKGGKVKKEETKSPSVDKENADETPVDEPISNIIEEVLAEGVGEVSTVPELEKVITKKKSTPKKKASKKKE